VKKNVGEGRLYYSLEAFMGYLLPGTLGFTLLLEAIVYSEFFIIISPLSLSREPQIS
jgi:hypothetical protein